jgi:hypothetical protein
MANEEVDQERIAKILGSTIRGKVKGGFGPANVQPLVEEYTKIKQEANRKPGKKSKRKD